MLSAFITGLAGLKLDAREAAVLRAARPCGVILFARNVADPTQVRRLSEDARDAVGSDILVLVDQEGGACGGCCRRTGASCPRQQRTGGFTRTAPPRPAGPRGWRRS